MVSVKYFKRFSFNLNSYTLFIAITWTIIITAFFFWDYIQIKKEALEYAHIYTHAAFQKDAFYRRWNALHGGVYVPVTDKTPPNPFLSGMIDRDIQTPAGKQLTLVNPAYMTRQVHELEKQTSDVRSHITSLNPINPENTPDEWEKKALEAFEHGEKEMTSVDTIWGKAYYRLMQPLIIEKSCLGCHAREGYKENDIRGGISVSLPMKPILKLSTAVTGRRLYVYLFIWLAGLVGIALGYVWLRKSESKRLQAEISLMAAYDVLEKKVEQRTTELVVANKALEQEIAERNNTQNALQINMLKFKTLAESAPVGIFQTDASGITSYVNPRWCEISQVGFDEALGNGWLNAVHPDDREKISKEWEQAPLSQTSSRAEYRFLHADGSISWVAGQAVPQHDLKGNIVGYLGTITDITELKQKEEALEESVKKYHALFDGANDGILIMSKDVFIDCNVMTLFMFGIEKKEDIVGQSPWKFSPPQQPDGSKSTEKATEMIQAAMDGLPQRFYWKHSKKNGDLFDSEVSLSRIILGDEVFVQALVRDITPRMQAEEELQNHRMHLEEMVQKRTAELEVARERAESADRLKSAFLATMSHELRTPLNSIIGFTGILMKELAGPINFEQRKQLGMAQNSARHLLSLINDILDISKIEAGQLQLSYEKFTLEEVIVKVKETVSVLAESKGLIINTFIPADIGEINSDKKRVGQILLNLVNNAIKFTDKGIVQIECSRTDKEIIIKVIDTGIGIEKDKLEYVFRPFSQIDTGISRNHDGSGLGLSISKKLIALLNGTISVESEIGAGSKFIITLPSKQV